jgi:hypothetical protein
MVETFMLNKQCWGRQLEVNIRLCVARQYDSSQLQLRCQRRLKADTYSLIAFETQCTAMPLSGGKALASVRQLIEINH